MASLGLLFHCSHFVQPSMDHNGTLRYVDSHIATSVFAGCSITLRMTLVSGESLPAVKESLIHHPWFSRQVDPLCQSI